MLRVQTFMASICMGQCTFSPYVCPQFVHGPWKKENICFQINTLVTFLFPERSTNLIRHPATSLRLRRKLKIWQWRNSSNYRRRGASSSSYVLQRAPWLFKSYRTDTVLYVLVFCLLSAVIAQLDQQSISVFISSTHRTNPATTSSPSLKRHPNWEEQTSSRLPWEKSDTLAADECVRERMTGSFPWFLQTFFVWSL